MQLYGLLPLHLTWTVPRCWKKTSYFVCSKFSFVGHKLLAPRCSPNIDAINLASYPAFCLFPLALLLVLCTMYVTCCLHGGEGARVTVGSPCSIVSTIIFPFFNVTGGFHVMFTVHLDINFTLCSPCILTLISRCVHRAS
jgi:hypothetical protein